MKRCQSCGRIVEGTFRRCIDCHNLMKDRLQTLKYEYLSREFSSAI